MTTELEIQSGDDASGASPGWRTRRSLLAAALGGIGAFAASALGRGVPATRAAAGDPFVIGQSNDAGTSQSIMLSSAGGAAFTLKDSAVGGTGVFGWSSGATGTGRGLYGRADSPSGNGIEARQNSDTAGSGAAVNAVGGNNTAVRAYSLKTAIWAYGSINRAIYAESAGGLALEAKAPGTVITATSTSHGDAIVADTGNGIAVDGDANTGTGVRGHSSSGTGVNATAVDGKAIVAGSISGDCIIATASSGYGLKANTTSGVAVYGYSTSNWSGWFGIDARVENDFQVGGNQSVAGNLSKGSGSFKIDHPLDPAGKYLYHSFVESPDMMNVYNGVETLDGKGEASISMPAWFEALNRDFRYQLTAHGSFSPLFVKSEMDHGRFTIAGGAAGQRVSWQVTGIRQDKFANANRIKVEEVKTGAERGTYLHPEVHGQPASKRAPGKHPTPEAPTLSGN